ncbi:MAG: hypothetical protein Q9161_006107 [Pseudevernia consocians]
MGPDGWWMSDEDVTKSAGPKLGNLDILKNVGDGVLRKRAVVDAGGVVDDYFGSAYFGHGNFEDSGEGTMIGHVHGVCVYGCGGGGGGDEGSITAEVEGGAGEEDDVGEAVRSEEAGDFSWCYYLELDEAPAALDPALDPSVVPPLTIKAPAFGPSCPLDSLYSATLVPLQLQFPLPLDPLDRSNDPLAELEDESLAEFDDESLPELEDESLPELEDESPPELEDESLPELEDESLPELDDEPLPELDDEPLPELEDESPPELDDDPLADEDEESLSELAEEEPPEVEDESLPEDDDAPLLELDEESLPELDDPELDDELDDALDEPSKLPNPDPYDPSSNAEQSGNNCANPTNTPGPTAPKNCPVTPLSAQRSICISFPYPVLTGCASV